MWVHKVHLMFSTHYYRGAPCLKLWKLTEITPVVELHSQAASSLFFKKYLMGVSGRGRVPLCRQSSEEGAGHLCRSSSQACSLYRLFCILLSAPPGLGCATGSAGGRPCGSLTLVFIGPQKVVLTTARLPRLDSCFIVRVSRSSPG